MALRLPQEGLGRKITAAAAAAAFPSKAQRGEVAETLQTGGMEKNLCAESTAPQSNPDCPQFNREKHCSSLLPYRFRAAFCPASCSSFRGYKVLLFQGSAHGY